MDNMLFTVSINVSPFLTDDCEAEKFITSADKRFSANSKDNLVLVEFSKNKLAIVISRSEGTFLIGRLITSLKWSAVLKISSSEYCGVYGTTGPVYNTSSINTIFLSSTCTLISVVLASKGLSLLLKSSL